MENIQIIRQYEPSSMQDIVLIEHPEETLETTEIEAPEPLESAPEMVDFHLTDATMTSLKVIVGWSKVIVACMALFMVIEALLMATIFTKTFTASAFSAKVLSEVARSGLSLGISGWLAAQSWQFIRQMGQALKTNDNGALAEGFRRQAIYFKWVYYNMAITVLLSIVMIFV